MDIGWIGLGAIGTQMVRRALAAGHRVTVYARGRGLAEVEAAGAQAAFDYAAIAKASEMLVLCVYSDAQLRDVLFEQGALAALRPGSVLVMHTTGSPDLAREIGEHAPTGVGVLDATFSGGPADVARGALAVIAGGEIGTLDRARPLLESYADRIHHVGPLGLGQTLKLLNNLLFAANLRNAAEVLRIAGQQGFETWTAAKVLQGCSGASYALGLFQPETPIEQRLASARPYLVKDVATALASAASAGLDVSAFDSVADYFAGDRD